MAEIISAEFFGTQINVTYYNGARWLTAEQVGLALGCSEANARQGAGHLYRRHSDEFGDADTCKVNLTSQGQSRKTRIFSASGCILLSFFANTKRAAAFRSWAKEALADKIINLPAVPDEQKTLVLAKEIGQMRDAIAAQNVATIELYKKLEKSQSARIRDLGIIGTLRRKLSAGERKDGMLAMRRAGATHAVIAARYGMTPKAVESALRRMRAAGLYTEPADGPAADPAAVRPVQLRMEV
jgi:prophage antirepressor-like protein